MTKEQQFNREDQQINRAMDNLAETKSKLREEILNLQLQNSILLNVLKEIAVKYPEDMSPEQDNILCKYLIARAQEAISKTAPETDLHPIFKNITDSIFPPPKNDL